MSWNIEEAITYYKSQGAPGDQNAVIRLLKEVQQENGDSIPIFAITQIAQAYGIRESFLQAIVKRIPSLRLSDTHCLEVCAGPNCGKRTELSAFVEELHRSAPDTFTLKYVPCMRMCGKGPNVKWDGQLYHRVTEQTLRKIIQGNQKA